VGAPPSWRERWKEPLSWPAAAAPSPDAPEAPREMPKLDQCALVVVDVDKKAFDRNIAHAAQDSATRGHQLAQRTYDVVVPNLVRLVEHFRARQRPVVFVQWGWHRFQYPPLRAIDGEDVVVKRSRGAFSTSNLHEVLQRHEAKACVLAGADTAICVTSTACGAIDQGYRVIVVDDATVSFWPEAQESAERLLAKMGTLVVSSDEVLTR
jgi:nicotinamidase-related amidase